MTGGAWCSANQSRWVNDPKGPGNPTPVLDRMDFPYPSLVIPPARAGKMPTSGGGFDLALISGKQDYTG
jgi:hypothetical protein